MPSAPEPSATLPTLTAFAFAPCATDCAPSAVAPLPSAIASACAELAACPIATPPGAVWSTIAPLPMPTPLSPLTTVVGPTATDSAPTASESAAVEFAWKYFWPVTANDCNAPASCRTVTASCCPVPSATLVI
ncbi:hypothetical protein CFB82_35120 [Burkholderia sp. HI2714]|nr:hypothetical protein CFB82_35120 [Burkholderia sp. HI2714]